MNFRLVALILLVLAAAAAPARAHTGDVGDSADLLGQLNSAFRAEALESEILRLGNEIAKKLRQIAAVQLATMSESRRTLKLAKLNAELVVLQTSLRLLQAEKGEASQPAPAPPRKEVPGCAESDVLDGYVPGIPGPVEPPSRFPGELRGSGGGQ
jgi:hypothetical protein